MLKQLLFTDPVYHVTAFAKESHILSTGLISFLSLLSSTIPQLWHEWVWCSSPVSHLCLCLPGHTGRFIKVVFCTSLLFVFTHICFQTVLYTYPPLSIAIGDNCSQWDTITRHIGVSRCVASFSTSYPHHCHWWLEEWLGKNEHSATVCIWCLCTDLCLLQLYSLTLYYCICDPIRPVQKFGLGPHWLGCVLLELLNNLHLWVFMSAWLCILMHTWSLVYTLYWKWRSLLHESETSQQLLHKNVWPHLTFAHLNLYMSQVSLGWSLECVTPSMSWPGRVCGCPGNSHPLLQTGQEQRNGGCC